MYWKLHLNAKPNQIFGVIGEQWYTSARPDSKDPDGILQGWCRAGTTDCQLRG